MQAVPVTVPFEDRAEQTLGAGLRVICDRRGFTAMQKAVTRQTEQLAKERRVQLAQQGWVA